VARDSTKVVWGRWRPSRDPFHEPIVPPIHISAIFRHPPGERHLSPPVGDLKYSRENNPTIMLLEEAMAEIEAGEWALAFNSGMAALATPLIAFLRPGQKLTVMRLAYGTTRGSPRAYLGE
jgi:cystathionine gamma-synthase